MSETSVKPRLTKFERAFVEAFDIGRFWIARDNFGLFLYLAEPEQWKGTWNNFDPELSDIEIKEHLFPFITWESGKTWSNDDLLSLEVEEHETD